MIHPYFLYFWPLFVWAYFSFDYIKFHYDGSIYEWLDSKLDRPWWKLNSRPEYKNKYPYFSMLWCGYHLYRWLASVFAWCGFAAALYPYLASYWAIAYLSLIVGVLTLTLHTLLFLIMDWVKK